MFSDTAMLDFCGFTKRNYLNRKPFVQHGWKYATDAAICIRIPSDEPDCGFDKFKPASVYVDFPGSEFVQLGSVTDRNGHPVCNACFNDGRVDRGACPGCEGEGCHACGDTGCRAGIRCTNCAGKELADWTAGDVFAFLVSCFAPRVTVSTSPSTAEDRGF